MTITKGPTLSSPELNEELTMQEAGIGTMGWNSDGFFSFWVNNIRFIEHARREQCVGKAAEIWPLMPHGAREHQGGQPVAAYCQ